MHSSSSETTRCPLEEKEGAGEGESTANVPTIEMDGECRDINAIVNEIILLKTAHARIVEIVDKYMSHAEMFRIEVEGMLEQIQQHLIPLEEEMDHLLSRRTDVYTKPVQEVEEEQEDEEEEGGKEGALAKNEDNLN